MSTKKPKSITLKGTKFLYKTPAELGNKLNVTTKVAQEYIKGQRGQIFIKDKFNRIGKTDIKDDEAVNILERFSIKKITNANLLLGSTLKRKDGDIVIKKQGFKGDDKVSLLDIDITATFLISEKEEIRFIKLPFTGLVKNIDQAVTKKVNEYLMNIIQGINNANIKVSVESVETNVISKFTNQEFTYNQSNSTLEKECPIDISNNFNVEINQGLGCVNNLFKHFKIKSNFDDVVSRKELVEFCNKKINLIIYDICGQIIYDNKCDVKKQIKFLDYNNHCYPVIGGQLTKKKKNAIKNIKYFSDDKILVDLIEKGIYPYDIIKDSIIKNNIIRNFVANDTLYISKNTNHKKICDFFKNVGIEYNNINYNFKLNKLFNILEKQYQINVNSFLPIKIIKPQLMYKSTIPINNNKKISTIDANKFYSSILRALEFLIKVDYKTTKINVKEEITNIKEHNLYVCEPIENRNLFDNILISQNNIHTGYFINKCLERGLNIKIIEELECEKVDNDYSNIIELIYNFLPEEDAKSVLNITIGNFNHHCEVSDNLFDIAGVFDNEEIKIYDGLKYKLSDKYSILYNKSNNKAIDDIYNKSPIHIQIKDEARLRVYDKIMELKLKEEDIIQINTDAITYYGELPKNLNKTFDGWKEIPFKEIGKCDILTDNLNISFFNKEDNDNILNTCYAGNGKSYKILNKIIKKYNNYLIITPSHKTLKEYRKLNLNCNVIQYYDKSKKIPDEDVIIIDELGMFDAEGNDFIYKMFKLNKKIIAYGDFNQLEPVVGTYNNSKQYLDLLFKKQKSFFKNYRNNFPKEYYDSIINEEIDFKQEVLKHSTKKYQDANIIITYRNEKTRDKYNELMLNHHGLKFGDIGCKVISITNNLKYKDIYNNFNFVITNNESGIITLDNEINITIKQLKANFIPYYACTIYSFQGDETKSYYFPEEDIDFIKNGKYAYTIISRIKEDLIIKDEKPKLINDKLLISFD